MGPSTLRSCSSPFYENATATNSEVRPPACHYSHDTPPQYRHSLLAAERNGGLSTSSVDENYQINDLILDIYPRSSDYTHMTNTHYSEILMNNEILIAELMSIDDWPLNNSITYCTHRYNANA